MKMACKLNSNAVRKLCTSTVTRKFNRPPTNKEMVRAGGIASMFRLPVYKDTKELDVCFVGVPLDVGASNRTGTRFGPRAIRSESVMLRSMNNDTGARPYESLQVGDVGDVNLNQYNLPQACKQIQQQFSKFVETGCKPLTMGGDHTISYPILQAIKEKHGPVCLIHIDAHTDLYGPFMGSEIHHGNPFMLAYTEKLIDPNKTIQIGLRGSGMENDYEVGKKLGFRVVPAKDCWWKSLTPLMEEVREMVGDKPVYISFDIDSLDPAYAPGTGTPEIGGLTGVQALEIIRGCRGLNIVGCDLVEVSPPYDIAGKTSIHAANLLFEMLCVLPGVKY